MSQDAARGRWVLTGWPSALLALWVCLACWGLSSPVLSSPDDNVHVALLYCQASLATCDQPNAPRTPPCFAFQPQVTADCLQRPLPVSTAGVTEGRYPGLYGIVLRPLVGGSVEGTVLRVRLFNLTLALAVMVLALRSCIPRLRPAALLAFAVSLVPLGVFLIPSINPSSWAIAGAAALWAPLLSLAKEGATGWRIGAVVAAAGMILGSRNEGWVIIAVTAAVALAAAWPRGRWLFVPAGLLAVSALVAVVRHNPGMSPTVSEGYRGPWETLLLSLTTPADAVGASAMFPTPLGWLDTPLPAVVGVLTVAAAAAVVFAGLGVMDRDKARAVAVYVVMAGAVIIAGWSTQFPSAFQPRFALPIVIVGLGVAVMPARAGAPTWTRTQGMILTLALAVANSLSLLALSLRFSVGAIFETTIEPSPPFPGPMDLLATGSVGWSLTPMSPFIAWILGTVCFAWFAGWVMLKCRSGNPVALSGRHLVKSD